MDIFDRLELRTTALMNSDIIEKCPAPAQACRDRGDEIAAHGPTRYKECNQRQKLPFGFSEIFYSNAQGLRDSTDRLATNERGEKAVPSDQFRPCE